MAAWLVVHLLLFGLVVAWLPWRAPSPRKVPFSVLSSTAARQSHEFARTNRVEAKWLKELIVLRENLIQNTATSTDANVETNPKDTSKYYEVHTQSGVNLIVELGKELLYSNIPEQMIELYSMYHEIVFSQDKKNIDYRKNSKIRSVSDSSPIVPNTKILSLTARALITLNDVNSALRLLQTVARVGIDFDRDEISMLISDLAISSPEGLRAALVMWDNVKRKDESLSVSAMSDLLTGIYKHGLRRTNEAHLDLLVRSTNIVDADGVIIETKKEAADKAEAFYVSTEKAEELAIEIVSTHIKSKKGKPGKVNVKIVAAALRVLFKVGNLEFKGTFDKTNYEPDEDEENHRRTLAGMASVIEAMIGLNLEWNTGICDILLDECLKVRDLDGVNFVRYIMGEVGLQLQTSSFNTLMQRYAENGDAESAYKLLQIMKLDNCTLPDRETNLLLIEAGNKSKKGRYYSQLIFADMIARNAMVKKSWDRLVELAILTNKTPDSIFVSMRESNCQPDQDTLVLMFRALLRRGEIGKAMKWYGRLKRGDKALRSTRENYILGKLSNCSSEKLQLDVDARAESDDADLYLPFPGKRVVLLLLEYLRDKGLHKEALYILENLSSRRMLSFQILEEKVAIEESKIKKDETEKEIKVLGNFGGKKVVMVKALSEQAKKQARKKVVSPAIIGDSFSCTHYTPDEDVYSLVMEACIISNNPELAMQVFNDMERAGLTPNRRIYSLLIRVFGALGDTESALGVFEEMRQSLIPDVDALQSILQVCMEDPIDLRQAACMLENMANEGIDLDVYSKDILMEAFPDAITLAENLILMQRQPIVKDLEVAKVSLSVVSCLVQATRRTKDLSGITEAIEFLGKVGIRLDKETTEYFTIPDIPMDNSEFSKHYHEKLLPHKEKVRSLLNIEMPVCYKSTFDVENRFYVSEEGRVDHVEPYFEYGKDSYRDFTSILLREICEERGCSVDTVNVYRDLTDAHVFDSFKNTSGSNEYELDLKRVGTYLDLITNEFSEDTRVQMKTSIDNILKRPSAVAKITDRGKARKKKGVKIKGGRKSLKMIIDKANDENGSIPVKKENKRRRATQQLATVVKKERR